MKQSEERWLISRWRWGSGARSIGEWVRLLEEAGDRIYRHPWLDVFANRFLRTFTVEPRAAVDDRYSQPPPDPERFNDFGPRLFTLDSASRRGNIICFFEPPEGGLGG